MKFCFVTFCRRSVTFFDVKMSTCKFKIEKHRRAEKECPLVLQNKGIPQPSRLSNNACHRKTGAMQTESSIKHKTHDKEGK